MAEGWGGHPPTAPGHGERGSGTDSYTAGGSRPRLSLQLTILLLVLVLVVGLAGGRYLFPASNDKASSAETAPSGEAPAGASKVDEGTQQPSPGPSRTSGGGAEVTAPTEVPAAGERPTTPARSPRKPIGINLVTPGEGFRWSDDWFVGASTVETVGQSTSMAYSLEGSFAIIPPVGTKRVTGRLVFGDKTETPYISAGIKVLVDGQPVNAGTLTPAEPFTIDLDTTDRRRVDVVTKIEGDAQTPHTAEIVIVFVDGFVE